MRLIRSNAPQVVILGGGYAGMLAAMRLAGRAAARLTLVNAAPHFVERIRLHQLAAGQTLPQRPLDALLRGSDVNLLIGKVIAIDAAEQRVQVERPDGSKLAVAWDFLLYALGSGPGGTAIAGAKDHLHTVANEAGARRLGATLQALPAGARVSVIGGGLTGIETASELAESYAQLRVSIVSSGEIGPGLSAVGRDSVRSSLRALGVEIHEGANVLAAEPGALILKSGPLPVDAAVLCAGFVASPLAAQSGLSVAASGQLIVDEALRVPGHPNLLGCGDGVSSPRGLRMACATAMPMAAHAADNLTALLCGRPLRPFGYSYFVQCVSIGRRRGIIQRVNSADAPRSFIVDGGIAARIKEAVCRFTTLSLTLERRFAGTYTWPGRKPKPVVEAVANLIS